MLNETVTEMSATSPTNTHMEEEMAKALKSLEIQGEHAEFEAEQELASAVMEVAQEEQDVINFAVDSAIEGGDLPRAPSVTESEIGESAMLFQIENALAEVEQELDPEADPSEGMDEATAAILDYELESELKPEPTPVTYQEIGESAVLFQMENALAEVEQELDPEADPSEGMDEATAAIVEYELENEMMMTTSDVDSMTEYYQEIGESAVLFQLENALMEAEQELDPEADPKEGMDEATAAIVDYELENELKDAKPVTYQEIGEAAVMFDLENAIYEAETEDIK